MRSQMPKEIFQNLASWAVASWVCGELGGDELGGVEMSVYGQTRTLHHLHCHTDWWISGLILYKSWELELNHIWPSAYWMIEV